MVSFTPTEDQQMLVEAIHRYAETDVRRIAHDADESGDIPPKVLAAGWEIGLIPASLPEEYGGFGAREALTGALAAEELAWGDLAVALKLMAPALFAYPVLMFGTEAQKEALLPLVLEEFVPLAAALAEPGVFFDPHALQTTATTENGGVILNGVKSNVPLAAEAQQFLIYARNSATDAVEAYVVESGAEGLAVGEREKLMGIRALPTYPLTLDNVRVTPESRLGGEAGIQFAPVMAHQQVALAALAVGVARASFEYARDYARERVQFGVPIATKQAIAFMLAEMAIEVDAARLMAWEAAWKLDQGQDAAREAYHASRYAAQAALFVADSGVQTLGGYGFIREYPVERWLRNARGFAMFSGLATV
ncbi:MAG: acyl-CoA dehydrogenase family protein [Anaerolineae bacterium]|nr:acyl-CoA dehydrogenase family protein [Anaerolineae bacterium]